MLVQAHTVRKIHAHLITTIANGMVAAVAARLKKSLCQRVQVHILSSRRKRMLGVMTMLKTDMAWDAEVKIFTGSASDEVVLRELFWRISKLLQTMSGRLMTYPQCRSCRFELQFRP